MNKEKPTYNKEWAGLSVHIQKLEAQLTED